MLSQIALTGFVGPLVSMLAAAISAVFFVLSFRLSRKMADRSEHMEAQKLLLEVNRQLIADPRLWGLYDDHPVRKDGSFDLDSPLFVAKLEAFAYFKLNMFEIILVHAETTRSKRKRAASNSWHDFYIYSIAHSSMTRSILDRPDSVHVYNPVLMKLYTDWKSTVEAHKIISAHKK
jgi:hypothetical protein